MSATMQFNQRPVPTFNEGTCVEYWSFRDQFKKHVQADTLSNSQRLELLVSAYSGSAKKELYACT
ncbi:hypothetical protein E2C01_079160 [Portunus trituberculatus]|uniref:Uncharacterized protein n=1 Tax=Portunus trituberculatus TaxID=210409 RepID=A0A5B7IKR8_PORTR|nr:hypothetical protein [Portunus trituberculatus]